MGNVIGRTHFIRKNKMGGIEVAIESTAASIMGGSGVRSVGSVVDGATSSRTAPNSGTSPSVHRFASAMDNAVRSTTALNSGTSPSLHRFAWAVDNAISSTTASYSGTSPSLHSFASAVDNAISSTTASYSGTSTVHSFVSVGAEALIEEVDHESSDIHNLSLNGNGNYFGSWQKGYILGKGSFGTVYEGITDDGFFFAVKEVSLLDDRSHGKQSMFQLQQEKSLLSRFRHENIVQYLGTDKDNEKLYIFLELLTEGSLASLYQKYCLMDSQVSAYTRQILSALKYLHDRNVVHRDIKGANILVDVNGSVKLADFGLAKATKLNDVKSIGGSLYWMAPEVVNLRNHGYGLAADIWSLGCTVLEMLTRQPPYSHLEGMQALFRIGKGQPPHVPESLSTDARDFILKCLQVNPNKRPTAARLLNHSFVKRPLLSPISPVSPSINLLLS